MPDVIVAHGYTLTDLEQLVRLSLRLNRWHTAADGEEQYDAVWFGVVEHVLAAVEAPTRGELLVAGIRAADRRVAVEMRTHGKSVSNRNWNAPAPRFAIYWDPSHAPSHEERIVERLTLQQVWPKLTARQQDAFVALATTGDYLRAAEVLGVRPGTLPVHLSKGRARFLQWWHEGEVPSKPWGTDRRVGSRSAARAATTKRRSPMANAARRTGLPVRELVHGRNSTYTNHACRCAPCTQAATDASRERSRARGAVPRVFKKPRARQEVTR